MSIRLALIPAGVGLLAVGIKALIDGHLAWGIILLMAGLGTIIAALSHWARAQAFAYNPPFLVAYAKGPAGEILTFSIAPGAGAITKLIFEPLAAIDGLLVIDPAEILFLHSHQPATCTVFVQEGIGTHTSGCDLRGFLESRKSGKMQVVARYTDAQGIRRRLPFNVELMGTHHQVEWVPGKAQKTEPGW